MVSKLGFARARTAVAYEWYVRQSAERETSFHGILHRSLFMDSAYRPYRA